MGEESIEERILQRCSQMEGLIGEGGFVPEHLVAMRQAAEFIRELTCQGIYGTLASKDGDPEGIALYLERAVQAYAAGSDEATALGEYIRLARDIKEIAARATAPQRGQTS